MIALLHARKEKMNRILIGICTNYLPDIEIENTAVSGINSGAFFAKLNELVLSVKQCDNLVILLGTNDLAMHKQVPARQF